MTGPQGHVAYTVDSFRTGRAYTLAEAAALAGTSYQNVRRWVLGYESPGHHMEPVFADNRPSTPSDEPFMVSFLQLVEIVVAARFRIGDSGHGAIKLERLRRAHEYARKRLGVQYPFASLKLQASGGHILHEFDEADQGTGVLALSASGQWVLPTLVRAEFAHVEFEGDLAARWFPLGHEVPIVVDPRIAGGRPTIVKTGVTVHTIRERFAAGESADFIAKDYQIEDSKVEQALQFAA